MHQCLMLRTRILSRGERVLWRGAPATGIQFYSGDPLVIPFSLMWCAGAFFWEFSVLTKVPNDHPGKWLFVLWGVPFVLVGLYITVGRFFDDAWRRRNTEYAVTNERAHPQRAIVAVANLTSSEDAPADDIVGSSQWCRVDPLWSGRTPESAAAARFRTCGERQRGALNHRRCTAQNNVSVAGTSKHPARGVVPVMAHSAIRR